MNDDPAHEILTTHPGGIEAIRRHWMNSSHQDECPAIGCDLSDIRCVCGYDEFEQALVAAGLIGKHHIDFKCGEDVPEPGDWWRPQYPKVKEAAP